MAILDNPANAGFLLDQVRDALLVVDPADGRIVDANGAAQLLYGYTREELVSHTIFVLRTVDPEVASRQMRMAMASEGVLFAATHTRRDGSQVAVEVSTRAITLEGRRLLLSVVRDVTERKRLEAERAALAETTQRALDARDEFLVIASHELRAPVTNVSLQLQRLLRQGTRADASVDPGEAARRALAEVERLSELIATLLDAQRVRGKIVLARGPLELRALVEEVASRVRAKLPGAAIAVRMDTVQGTWDRLRLEQVFTNLLANAHKYGRGKPIEVTANVDGQVVHVDVRDEGIGISPEDVPRVFDKFERAVPQSYGGFGLGLYITRQLVEAHDGRISVESVPGVGSTFRVTLPLAAADAPG